MESTSITSYVVNFDLPQSAEDYVHRIGRTGRAGSQGQAISLVSIDDANELRAIENLLKNKIPKKIILAMSLTPLSYRKLRKRTAEPQDRGTAYVADSKFNNQHKNTNATNDCRNTPSYMVRIIFKEKTI